MLGAVNTGNKAVAKKEISELKRLHALLVRKDPYQASQVLIQIKSAEAWLSYLEGDVPTALAGLLEAAEMEDYTDKHPVTPCEIVPQRELLGDLFLKIKQPAKALEAYEASLKKNPNRFNSLYGAAVAADKMGDETKAKNFYTSLQTQVSAGNSQRPELRVASTYLKTH